MKFSLLPVVFLTCGLTACNTVENRRSLYSPTKASGPYTQSLRDGSWSRRHAKPVDEEYAEAKAQKKRAQPVATKPAVSPAPSPVTAPLPE